MRLRFLPRFSLRSLLLMTTLFAVLFGLATAWRARAERRVAILKELAGFSLGTDGDELNYRLSEVLDDTDFSRWIAQRLSQVFFLFGDANKREMPPLLLPETFKAFPEIRRIGFAPWPSRPNWTEAFALPNLHKLDLEAETFSPQTLTPFRNCRSLVELWLSQERYGHGDLSILKNFPNLRSVSLSGFQLNREDMEFLARLPRLERLEVTGESYLIEPGVDHCDPWCDSLTKFSNSLRELRIHFFDLSQSELDGFASCPKLEILDLRGCAASDTTFVHLENWKELRVFTIGDGRTDSTIDSLPYSAEPYSHSFRGLRGLPVDVSDSTLYRLRGHTRLECLAAPSRKITNNGLEALSQLPSLRAIALPYSNLKNPDLEPFARMPRLTYLDLSYTPLSVADVQPIFQSASLNTLELVDVHLEPGPWLQEAREDSSLTTIDFGVGVMRPEDCHCLACQWGEEDHPLPSAQVFTPSNRFPGPNWRESHFGRRARPKNVSQYACRIADAYDLDSYEEWEAPIPTILDFILRDGLQIFTPALASIVAFLALMFRMKRKAILVTTFSFAILTSVFLVWHARASRQTIVAYELNRSASIELGWHYHGTWEEEGEEEELSSSTLFALPFIRDYLAPICVIWYMNREDGVEAKTLEQLDGAYGLQSIHVHEDIRRIDPRLLRQHHQLKELSFSQTESLEDVDEAEIATLMATLGNLRELRDLTLINMPMSPRTLGFLRDCPKLARMSLIGTSVAPDCLVALKRSTNLVELNVGLVRGSSVATIDLTPLGKLTKLKSVTVDGLRVGDEDLAALSHCGDLETVGLTNAFVSDRGMEAVDAWPNLLNLTIHPALTGREPEKLPISDASLIRLAKKSKLETLILSAAGATDEGVEALSDLQELRQLAIRDGQIRCPNLTGFRKAGTLTVDLRGNPLSERIIEKVIEHGGVTCLGFRGTPIDNLDLQFLTLPNSWSFDNAVLKRSNSVSLYFDLHDPRYRESITWGPGF